MSTFDDLLGAVIGLGVAYWLITRTGGATPIRKYKCDNNNNCIEDSNGIHTLTECQNICGIISGENIDLFLSDSEINIIKNNLNNYPWNTAYNEVEADSNFWMNNTLPKLASDNHCFTDSSSYGGGADYQAATKLKEACISLGLRYRLTGNKSYANRLIDAIYKWCLNPNTYMKSNTTCGSAEETIHQCGVTLPGMFFGASLIWSYWGSSSDTSSHKNEKNKFKNWCNNISNYAKSKDFCEKRGWCQNKELTRLVLVASAGRIAGNNNNVNYAISRYKWMLNPDNLGGIISSVGCMSNEANRDAAGGGGLHYSLLAMTAITGLAEIAKHYNNTDLYTYNISGRSFESALDNYVKYGKANDPDSYWRSNCCTSKDGRICKEQTNVGRDEFALYEVAYTRLGKSTYKDVVNVRGRPMSGKYIFKYETLIYGR